MNSARAFGADTWCDGSGDCAGYTRPHGRHIVAGGLIGRRFVVPDGLAVSGELGGKRGTIVDAEDVDLDGHPAKMYRVRFDGDPGTRTVNDYEAVLTPPAFSSIARLRTAVALLEAITDDVILSVTTRYTGELAEVLERIDAGEL